MNFITSLPINFQQHDLIMVVVDKLSKDPHFIPVKPTYKCVSLSKTITFGTPCNLNIYFMKIYTMLKNLKLYLTGIK